MKKIILYIWQLPQNIAGCSILLYHRIICKHSLKIVIDYTGFTYYVVKHLNNCGISLGRYVIFDYDIFLREIDIKHEQGHQKQSLILGWLYLPVIGLPSAIGNLLHRKLKFEYYKQPWEAWADKLGGVER